MKLIDHLPLILQGVAEYRALCDALEEEMISLRGGIEAVRRNLVISTAEEEGLSRWESALGISGTGSLSDRRAAILARMVDLPYSLVRLRSRLIGMVGENGFVLHAEGLRVHILLSLEAQGAFSEVCRTIRRILPANIELTVEVKLTTNREIAGMTHAVLAGFTHEEIRNEVATSGGSNTEL